MAKQLLYPREDLERLGRWGPAILMPDRYDRAICSADWRARWIFLNEFETGGRRLGRLEPKKRPPI